MNQEVSIIVDVLVHGSKKGLKQDKIYDWSLDEDKEPYQKFKGFSGGMSIRPRQ